MQFSNTADIINNTCATCLSQGRKFSPINEQNIELLFCLKIKLSRNEKLCWECQAMMKKIIYFTNKAHKAQALLAQLLVNVQGNIPESLSELKTTLITTISYKTIDKKTPPERLYVQMGNKTQEYEVLDQKSISPLPIEDDFEFCNIDFEKDGSKFSVLDDATDLEMVIPKETISLKGNLKSSDSECVKQPVFREHSKRNNGYMKDFDMKMAPKLIANNLSSDFEELINYGTNNRKIDKNKSGIETTKEIKNAVKIEILNRETSSKDGDIYLYKKMDDIQMLQLRESKRQSKQFQASKYKCERCIEIFTKESMLNKHTEKHNQRADTRALSCRVCEQRFFSLYELNSHFQTHYDCYMCRWCSFECDQIDDMTKHYEFLHELNIAECDVCENEFQTVKDYRVHKYNCRKRKKPCKFCGRMVTITNMSRHLLIHSGMPVLECETCYKRYRGKWGLKAHMRTHSQLTDESAYCTECDIQFSTVSIFKKHLTSSLKHVAQEDLKHKCLKCDKRFAVPSVMKEHMDAQHTESMNYTCETCNKPFKTKHVLRQHIRLKHEGKPQPRNKVCSVCDKAFINKACLQQHMNTHTGARPYVCQECGDTFGFSGALYTHRKLKHKLQKRNSNLNNTEETVA